MIVDGIEFRRHCEYGDYDFRRPRRQDPSWSRFAVGTQVRPRPALLESDPTYSEATLGPDEDREVSMGECDEMKVKVAAGTIGVIVGGIVPRIVCHLKMSGVPRSVEYVVPVAFAGHPIAWFEPDNLVVIR